MNKQPLWSDDKDVWEILDGVSEHGDLYSSSVIYSLFEDIQYLKEALVDQDSQ